MPTIQQLPAAGTTNLTDELPVAQGDVTRGVTLATLLANLQPLIVVSGEALLGRTSVGVGGIELITAGAGLTLAAGTLSATGAEQSGFAMQPLLTLTDEVVLNSGGQPRRMQLPLLRGLFEAGPSISIDPTGVISATVPIFRTGIGAPVQGVGSDGDTYLDVTTGSLWAYASGAWTDTGRNILAAEATARAAQIAPLVGLTARSTGTVPVPLTLDGTAQTEPQTLVLPNAQSLMRLTGSVMAQDLASGDAIVWDIAAAVKRVGAGLAPALLGSASISVFAADHSMTGCQLSVAANQSGGLLQGVGVIGLAINWSATLLVVDGT